MIVETTIRRKPRVLRSGPSGDHYFYVAFLFQMESGQGPVARVLARLTSDEGKALDLDDRLRRYVASFQATLPTVPLIPDTAI